MLTVFVLGGVTVLAVEAVGIVMLIWCFMRRLSRQGGKGKPTEESLPFAGDIDPSFYKKQAGITFFRLSPNFGKKKDF